MTIRNRITSYFWALGLLTAALGLRIALDPWLGDTLSHPTIFTAVLLTTWYFGTGPAILSTMAGYPVIELLVLESSFADWHLHYLIPSLCLYLGLNGTIIAFVTKFRRERDRLRETEAVLRDSEQRMRASFDNAALGIVETDGHDHIAAVNDRICRMLDYNREEMKGMSVHDLTAPEDRPRSDELNADLRAGRVDRLDYEKRYLRRDGSPLWVHITVSPVHDAAGKYVRSIGTVEDISKRRQSEEALRESESFYRQTLESIPGMVFTTRPDGFCDYQSQQWVDFTGVPMDEHIGDGWNALLHPEDRSRAYAAWRAAVEEMAEYDLEYRVRRYDGRHEWFKVLGRPIRDAEGRIARWFGIAANIDVLKRSEEALRESELRLRLAQEAGNIGVFDWNIQTGVNVWSPRLESMYGLPAGGFAGTQQAWEQLVHPEDRTEALGKVQAALETGQQERGEWRVVWPDGSVHWIAAWFQVFKDETGKPQRMTGVNIDITERKRLEHELRAAMTSAERAKQAAEEANSAKDQFLAVLSHELRTPLTPVLAAIQLIERKKKLGASLQHHVEVIRRNLELEARLIDDLLDLTRIVRGKVILDRQRLHVRDLIERVVETCGPDMEARKLHFGVEMTGSAHYVDGDPSRLQQVLWNVLKNAIKFTPDGGCVGIRCYQDSGQVVIEVNDSGIGIEPESISRIFNAFEQGGPRVTRQFGGLGLGLAITKRLVEMHDGVISAQSEGKNRGSTFRISLPAFPQQAEISARKAVDARTAVPERAQKRILLVEDHGDTALMMKMLLESSGYLVETAGDVQQALEIAGSTDIDLLISDLGLPDRSGLDLIRELRFRGSAIKAIALSGYGREEDVERSRKAGFEVHLTKPVDFDLLVRTVDSVISRAA